MAGWSAGVQSELAAFLSGGQERGCGQRPSRSMSASALAWDSIRPFIRGEAAATGLSGTVAVRLAIRPPLGVASERVVA